MYYEIVLNHTQTNYTVGGSAAVKNTTIATFYGRKPEDFIVNGLWCEIRDELIDNSPERVTQFENGKEGYHIRFEYDNSLVVDYYSLKVIEFDPEISEEEEEEW